MVVWVGSSKGVDTPPSTLVEGKLVGMAHFAELAELSVYMGLWPGSEASQLVGVENASGRAQKPEEAVGFELPRVSAYVADQARC